MSSPWQLNLSNNRLCGVWEEYVGGSEYQQKGTYNAEGITVLANALRVNASVSRLDARYNNLGDEGEAILREVVKEKPGFELLL